MKTFSLRAWVSGVPIGLFLAWVMVFCGSPPGRDPPEARGGGEAGGLSAAHMQPGAGRDFGTEGAPQSGQGAAEGSRGVWQGGVQADGTSRWAVRELTPEEAARPENEGVRYLAANPGQPLHVRFLDHGVRLGSGLGGEWTGTVRFRGSDPDPAAPVARGNRVEYQHPDGIIEWFVNDPGGLEHGLTIPRRPPARSSDDALRLEFALAGLKARPAVGARVGAVELVRPEDQAVVLLYDRLAVQDAQGRGLPARLEAVEDRLAMVIDDRGAEYPVSVDPWFSTLEARWAPQIAGFGRAVALSGDTALVGANFDSGSAHVFVRQAGIWASEAWLTPTDSESYGSFGQAVALSGDTALVAASSSVYVFVRNGGVWTQQARFGVSGRSVALSGDTALVGDYGAAVDGVAGAGRVHVFTREGGIWTQQASLVARKPAAYQYFGASVALAGERALVGAPGGFDASGASLRGAYALVRIAGSYWYEQAKLTPTGGHSGDAFGWEVALSGDTALVSASHDRLGSWWHDYGSAYVFERDWAGWTQRAKLTSADPYSYFGQPIALSGELALVGEFYPPAGAHMWPGRLHVFTRSGSGWSLQGQLTASDLGGQGHFGSSVAMAGETVLVGACYAENWPQAPVGAAYVFRLEKAAPTLLQLPSASPITYGQSLASSGLTGGAADVPGTFAFTDPAIVPQAGLGSFEVTFTPVDTAGYRSAMALVPVMVKRAPLTIRANDQEKVVGSENPPLTASYAGFVPGDSPEVLDVPVTLSTTAKANSPVGSYPITARGAADANYVITHQDGVLTVVEPGIFFCTEAGSGELRSLDMDPDRPGAQYRLIFNAVPQAPGIYRLPSSAPGILAGAVHYPAPPGTVVRSRLSVPVPLQLAGARPVRVFGDFEARDTGGGGWSIRLGPEITGAFSIHLTSTADGTTVEVSGSMPASGVIGIVLQLENAWKKTVGWTFDAGLNAAGTPGTSSAGGRLPQFQASVLSARWGTQTKPEVRYRARIETENRLNR